MSEIDSSRHDTKKGVDLAFDLASWPVREMRGGGSIVPGVLLAIITLWYVFIVLPISAIVRWMRAADCDRSQPNPPLR